MVRKYKNIKLLVTGASGMLGSNYIKMSENIFDLTITSSSNNKYQLLDLTNSTEVKQILDNFNPDIIVNCSAYTDVDQAEKNKHLAHSINVDGLNNIIKYSNKNTKIIHISSDYIYDGRTAPYTEEDTPNPINYYGKTKHEADNMLISSLRDFLIFRVNGLFSFTNHNNFYNWVYTSLKNNIAINVVDDQISNPTYINSLVDIINNSILLDLSGVYNYGTQDFISRYDFANIIAEYFDFNKTLINPIKTKHLEQLANRPLNTGLDCEKIQKVLDMELETIPYILSRCK